MAQRLTDQVVGAVHEPALAALLLGKSAQASEHGIDFVVGEDVAGPSGIAPSRDLVTIVGNLLDNAFDARGHGQRRRAWCASTPASATGTLC